MTTVGKSQGAAIDIGEVAAPPFVRLPVPQTMFAERAARLRTLASSHALADALAFFAAIAEAQHAVQSTLAPPAPAAPATVAQALEHGMPPLNRYTWTPDRGFRDDRDAAGFRARRLRQAGIGRGVAAHGGETRTTACWTVGRRIC